MLRRFQEIVNGHIGLVPLFTQFDNIAMWEHVQGYVYYPDMVPVLAKMNLAWGRPAHGIIGVRAHTSPVDSADAARGERHHVLSHRPDSG